MAHTDKDLPYRVKADRFATHEDHYTCEHDPLGRMATESHIVEHVVAPHWHRVTRLVPSDMLASLSRFDNIVYDETLDCYFREVASTIEGDDGRKVPVSTWERVRPYDVPARREVTQWVFGPKVVREVVRRKYVRECDIDSRDSTARGRHCTRSGGEPGHRRWWNYSPDPEFRHLLYYGPERAHVRDTLRAAVDDYNTYGETDIEPISRQGRRSTWYGGWWD